MNDNSVEGFELYRRQRERRRLMHGTQSADTQTSSTSPNALRELEEVEEREHRDQQLQREVHEFFETSTRTAADIVQKVADTAKVQIDEQLSLDMQEFLRDSLARMHDFVHAVLAKNHGSRVEEVIEPLMHNLTGRMLDRFRQAGTTPPNHLGQDPMETDLEDVRREFGQKMPPPKSTEPDLTPDQASDLMIDMPSAALQGGSADPHVPAISNEPAPIELEPDDGADEATAKPSAQASVDDLKRFKKALETLVRQGNMSKADARAAWEARKASARR